MRSRSRKTYQGISLFAFQDIITSVTGILILITLLFSLELTRPTEVSRAAMEAVDYEALQAKAAALEEQAALKSQRFESNQTLLQEAAALSPRDLTKMESDLTARLAEAGNAIRELEAQSATLADAARLLDEQQIDPGQSELADLARQLNQLRDDVARALKTRKVAYNANSLAAKSPRFLDLSGTRIRVVALGGQPPVEFATSRRLGPPSDFRRWIGQRDRSLEYMVLLVRPSALTYFREVEQSLKDAGFESGVDLLAEDAEVELSLGGTLP